MAIDQTPATNLGVGLESNQPHGIHFHINHEASEYNNNSDFPNVPAGANVSKAVTAKIGQANGGPRFSNPS